MRKLCILFCLISFPLVSLAQNKIGYSYDAAGNRIKREIVMSNPKTMVRKRPADNQDKTYSDRLNGHSVQIQSNPTQGTLRINILGKEDTDRCKLEIYSMKGIQIMKNEMKGDIMDVDISNQPAGVYILKITINGNSTTWKIIKE